MKSALASLHIPIVSVALPFLELKLQTGHIPVEALESFDHFSLRLFLFHLFPPKVISLHGRSVTPAGQLRGHPGCSS
jgi:hypothetical protein